MIRTFPDLLSSALPIVRRLKSKFHHPAQGTIRSRARIAEETGGKLRHEYAAKGRALIEVSVEVVDTAGTVTMTAMVEWFIQRAS